MKQKLLRLVFLPAILCTLFAVGSFTTAGVAHAATRQSHVTQSSADDGEGDVLRDNSCNNATDLQMTTDYTTSNPIGDVDCFYLYYEVTQGYDYVKLYNVYEMYTQAYTVTWNWTDCKGGKHLSSKPPYTWVSALTAGSGKFAGYDVMCEITFLGLSIG